MGHKDDETGFVASVITVLQYAFLFLIAHIKDFFARFLPKAGARTPKVRFMKRAYITCGMQIQSACFFTD